MFFHSPYWLLAGLVLAGSAAALALLLHRRQGQVWRRYMGARQDTSVRVRLYLRMGGVGLLALALGGPSFTADTEEQPLLQRNIYFALDLSASMAVPDLAPTRLDMAKRVINRLTTELQGEQMGVIGYTDFAYVQCPLTRDADMVRTFADLLKPEQFAAKGTNLRAAMLAAIERFDSTEQATASLSAKCILLFTDGETQEPPLQSVINRLKARNISVIPVGVGTDRGGPVPDGAGGYLKTANGVLSHSALNRSLLDELAAEMGTRTVYLGDDPAASMAELLAAVRAQPLAYTRDDASRRRPNHYLLLLVPAALLIFISLWLLPGQPAPPKGAAS